MEYKYCFKLINCMLCDIRKDVGILFDYLLAIIGGYFTQILFIVKNCNCASIINVFIQKYMQCLKLIILILCQNMKL